MKLLLDQGLPRSAVRLLREAGVDAVHTGDCGLAAASDEQIIRAALREERVVVTLDADFHSLVVLGGGTGPSVVRVRIEGLDAPALVGVIRTALLRCGEDLLHGALVSVEETRIRVRRLPVDR
jgi:predicted nuclease of predicted toxin-antitoxin system